MKGAKIWLIISAILMAGGIGLAAIGTAKGGKWNMRFNLSDFKVTTGSENYVTETLPQDPFSKLIVKTDTIDVNISKGSEYSVTYFVPEDKVPLIENTNGVLTITAKKEAGFTFFNFSSFGDNENPYINVTVPDEETRMAFDIESSTGDISVTGLSFEGPITTSTGDIKLSQNKMGRMKFEVSTGDITTDNCSFETLETSASTGEVKIYNTICDGAYTANTSTGDITVSNSEFNSFSADGSTSDITVHNSKINNVLIETSTGDVELGLIGNEAEYSTTLSSSTGDIEVNHDEFEKKYNRTNSGSNSVNVQTSTGDIILNFTK